MSWFRSSRRRRSQEHAEAEAPAPAGPPRPARASLEGRPLADLHALAAQWEVPRYRLLRHAQLIEAISGEPAPAAPAAQEPSRPPALEPEPEPERKREPEPEPEPERKPEPEPEPEAGGEGEYRAGILDLVREGYGFLRIHGLTRSPDDPYVSRDLVGRHSLRRGDAVAALVAERRSGERHARVVSLTRRAGTVPAQSIEDMPAERPHRPLRPPAGSNNFAARMVELVAPLAAGQRALVAGPPGAGATYLLRELTRALIGGAARLIVVLVDVRPEEVPEWGLPESVEVHRAPGDAPREQVALAELALARAQRLAEQGEDVVVVLDSISRLARAYGLARIRRGPDAPAPELLAVEGAKRWFAGARETGSGSVTLLAAARVDAESALETLVHETLLDTAAAVVRLDPELAARGLHPAIDVQRSLTLGEDAIVAERDRAGLEALRSAIRSRQPADAWELMAERIRATPSNEQLLEG